MAKVRQISLIQDVKNMLEESFPDGWIDELDWSTSEMSKKSFGVGSKKIIAARDRLFVIFSKAVLQGDHLRFSFDGLDDLTEKCTFEIIDEENKAKLSLCRHCSQLLDELRSAIVLVKFHFNITSGLFLVRDSRKRVMNFIELESRSISEGCWLLTLDMIIDVCFFEYRFTYNQDKIRELLIKKEHLEEAKKRVTDIEVKECINSTISKVDLLLLKLSHFAKDNRIEYQFNFKKTVVTPSSPDSITNQNYSNYLKFIDPEKYISAEDVYQWQTHPNKKWAKMGQMVLLMRYYTKVVENITQAENLLSEYESFYNEKKNSVFYEYNKYAIRSVRGYMYNCLFSLKCKNHQNYSFGSLLVDIEEIRTIQNVCMIYNYHPFQKAIEFIIGSIKNDITNRQKKEIIEEKFETLKKLQSEYHNNIEWCVQNQCYPFQLTFSECTEINTERSNKIFHPSSFSRPLKFDEILKKRDRIDLEISMIHSEVSKYDDIITIQEAQKKIENMERKNMEQMGLFVTLTTFLVGLLSIFIGNNGSVSILCKVEYVIAIGLILLIFVCFGYFAISEHSNTKRNYLFGGLGMLCAIALVGICCSSKENKQNNNVKPNNFSIDNSVNTKQSYVGHFNKQ